MLYWVVKSSRMYGLHKLDLIFFFFDEDINVGGWKRDTGSMRSLKGEYNQNLLHGIRKKLIK